MSYLSFTFWPSAQFKLHIHSKVGMHQLIEIRKISIWTLVLSCSYSGPKIQKATPWRRVETNKVGRISKDRNHIHEKKFESTKKSWKLSKKAWNYGTTVLSLLEFSYHSDFTWNQFVQFRTSKTAIFERFWILILKNLSH